MTNGISLTNGRIICPQKTPADAVHAFAKAGISMIPIIGGPAVELFQSLIQPPLEKRRDHWMADVGEKLHELEANGFTLESLQNNEQFISAVMHASQIALRTHQKAKLEALRNAILNVAVGRAPDETFQNLFFNLIDSLTEEHLRILKVFQAPNSPPHITMGGLNVVLEHNIPESRDHKDLYVQLWKDLFSRGLVNTEGMNVMMSGNGLAEKRTTSIGDAFLKFIADST